MLLYLEIFAASLSAIVLEVAYTRIFSFKVFYYFTYVIIGVALMGLGAGGIAVTLSDRLRRARPERLLPAAFFAAGLAILVGYWFIAPMALDVSRMDLQPFEAVKLALACLILAVPFTLVGVIVAYILGSAPDRAGRLYATDLVGAGLGCLVSIPLLFAIDPPRTVMVSALVLGLGGLRLAWRAPRWRLAGLGLAALLAVPVATGKTLEDPATDRGKLLEGYREEGLVVYSKWNPVFRLDVVDHPFFPGDLFLVFHDALPGSGLRRFDGDLKKHARFEKDPRSLPFQVIPKHPEVLIIGSAGGHEVLASLYFGAKHVTGVELNTATLSLLHDRFADITGHLPDNPKVDFVNGDARWYLKQTSDRYDLIWYVAPDSYAAMNAATSGAFVLSESYLYTVEMLKETLDHLTDEGVVCAQFGDMDFARRPNRVTRFVTTAREALEERGITDVQRHLLVAAAPGFPPQRDSVILVSRTPISADRVARFAAQAPKVEQGALLFAPGYPYEPSPVGEVVTLPDAELPAFYRRYPYRVDPVFDDEPFFWHFADFGKAFASDEGLGGGAIDYEIAIGERFIVYLLGIVTVLAALLLLSPLVLVRDVFAEMPHKARTALYFAALGVGFMFVEVSLIQRFTLLVGYPTRSLTVTLFGLLLSSGLGSLLSTRYAHRREALLVLLGLLVLVVIAYQLGLTWVIDQAGGASLALRAVLTVALLAPLGLVLGAFMPLGLGVVMGLSPHPRQYVAWSWAINGFFSVVASSAATILAMVAGYSWVLWVSLGVYAIGVLSLWTVPRAPASSG
jgi:spermidine synthase